MEWQAWCSHTMDITKLFMLFSMWLTFCLYVSLVYVPVYIFGQYVTVNFMRIYRLDFSKQGQLPADVDKSIKFLLVGHWLHHDLTDLLTADSCLCLLQVTYYCWYWLLLLTYSHISNLSSVWECLFAGKILVVGIVILVYHIHDLTLSET